MPEQRGGMGAFRLPLFRFFWISSVFSNTGFMIQTVGAAWAMTMLTSSHSMVALVQASITLPMMMLAFVAGVLADSFDRRRVMLSSQIFMMVVSVLLAGLTFAGLMSPWLLLTFTFLIGCGQAMHNPSWQSSFSDIVPRDELPSAVSMNAMGMNLTRSVGPALGGAITAAFGAAAAFAINAASYFALIWALLRWRPEHKKGRLPRERFPGAFAGGVRYFLLSPNLLAIDFRAFLFGLSGISLQALLPLIVRDTLGGGALAYGVQLGAFGFGAVLGALGSSRLRLRFANETIARSCITLFAAGCVVIAFSTSSVLTALALVVSGGAWLIVNSLQNVTVQLSVPRWVLGRMISMYMTCIFGGMALGSWIWGEVADLYSLSVALVASAAIQLLAALWGLRFPMEETGSLNLDPLDRFNEPALKLDLNRRSGPIFVMIDYDIAQEDVPEFLQAMRDRRRIRIRDGAQRWALLRDLENPDLWFESYHIPTWTDYIRHVSRRTVADEDVIKKLQTLNRSEKRLRVHHMIERQTVVPLDDTPRIITKPESPH